MQQKMCIRLCIRLKLSIKYFVLDHFVDWIIDSLFCILLLICSTAEESHLSLILRWLSFDKYNMSNSYNNYVLQGKNITIEWSSHYLLPCFTCSVSVIRITCTITFNSTFIIATQCLCVRNRFSQLFTPCLVECNHQNWRIILSDGAKHWWILGRGARSCALSFWPNSLYFHAVFGKFGEIIGWHPPRLGNPGSALLK